MQRETGNLLGLQRLQRLGRAGNLNAEDALLARTSNQNWRRRREKWRAGCCVRAGCPDRAGCWENHPGEPVAGQSQMHRRARAVEGDPEGRKSPQGRVVHSLVLHLNPRDLRECTPRNAGVRTSQEVTNVAAEAANEIIVVKTLSFL